MTEPEAIAALDAALTDPDPQARHRVMTWALAKFAAVPNPPVVNPPTWRPLTYPGLLPEGITFSNVEPRGCMWDGVKPGTPMLMVCQCPKCSPTWTTGSILTDSTGNNILCTSTQLFTSPNALAHS